MVKKTAVLPVIVLMLLILPVTLKAQVNQSIFARLESKTPGVGIVQIKQNTEITNMVNLHISQMRKLNGIKGFRVCIYYNSGQEANKGADQERGRFISKYEDINSYKAFESPFFKVYVGDFRTKSEALKFLERIRYDYPNAFIRENIIVSFPD